MKSKKVKDIVVAAAAVVLVLKKKNVRDWIWSVRCQGVCGLEIRVERNLFA